MTIRKRGRPPRNEVTVTPEAILVEALDILDRDGAEALTMRALARRLDANPMTIYHHFGDRDGLIKAMAERAYSGVSAPERGDARQRIAGLMLSYHSQVVQHPGLALTIFRMPSVFPDQARRISDDLITLLRQSGLSPSQSRLWLNILVDFTHGAALATAMSRPPATENGAADARDDDHANALAALLDSLVTASH